MSDDVPFLGLSYTDTSDQMKYDIIHKMLNKIQLIKQHRGFKIVCYTNPIVPANEYYEFGVDKITYDTINPTKNVFFYDTTRSPHCILIKHPIGAYDELVSYSMKTMIIPFK